MSRNIELAIGERILAEENVQVAWQANFTSYNYYPEYVDLILTNMRIIIFPPYNRTSLFEDVAIGAVLRLLAELLDQQYHGIKMPKCPKNTFVIPIKNTSIFRIIEKKMFVFRECAMSIRIKLPKEYKYIAIRWNSESSAPAYEFLNKILEVAKVNHAERIMHDLDLHQINWDTVVKD